MESVAIDWTNLGFRLTPAKTMYVAKTSVDREWPQGNFIPYGDLHISPAAGVLNYGQGIIEGLKAFIDHRGQTVIFRPYENAFRFARGAMRMSMPPVPPEHFVEVIADLVRHNRAYIPPVGLGSLYLRPCLWGTGEILGMAPASEYTFVIYASPVGNYFKTGQMTPVKFEVCDTFHRSAALGAGSTKFIGNYAPSLLSTESAKSRGYAGCLYLDSVQGKYVEEAGVANFFCIKDRQLLTPQLSESILSGVTRASIIQLAREILKLEVVETQLSIQTVLQADECFCTGTAAVVTAIGSIAYQGRETVFNEFKVGSYTHELHDRLVKIQLGLVEDHFGWLTPVN